MQKAKSETPITPLNSTTTLHQYGGLEYVTVTHIPVICSGEVPYDCEIQLFSKLNEAITRRIIRKNFPIRGAELRFFRVNALKWPMDRLARAFSINTSTISRWEQIGAQRLQLISELAVRSLIAEKLGMAIHLRLLSNPAAVHHIKINARHLVTFQEVRRSALHLYNDWNDYQNTL